MVKGAGRKNRSTKRKQGFRARMKQGGAVIQSRRAKGRQRLSV